MLHLAGMWKRQNYPALARSLGCTDVADDRAPYEKPNSQRRVDYKACGGDLQEDR